MGPVPSGRLILASASPRRLDLLRQIAIEPALVEHPDVDEAPLRRELPAKTAVRLAHAKAQAIAPRFPADFVLSADTVVACGRRLLGKAETEDDVRGFLTLLSGRRHRVYTAVVLCAPGGTVRERLVQTAVVVRRLDQTDMAAYLASDEWRGKAGGYAIQGRFAAHVRQIVGSYSNVVGLPLFETAALLRGSGFRL